MREPKYKLDESTYSAGRFANETNDCAVRAFATAACIPYADAHALLAKHGRKDRQGTWRSTQRKAWEESLGYTPKHVVDHTGYTYQAMTLAAFLRRFTRGHWIVLTRGHSFAVVDGVVYDHTLRPRCRILDAYRFD